ncbi:cytochrome P450 [Kribbella antibiotica]|uniref:Cytochrome P450 n=1 Tax=Kribbella antibiotica TaxID=190195 RepID=A0A4R4YKM3_9ACTN|nr:cytochrome P450 [Kribbella antibiotica]TDD43982.1 cytochrome P450 [Kribbella antibiotica]
MTERDAIDYPLAPIAAIEPPEEWAELRQQCPVAHVRLPSGDQATLLTRYDDIRQLMSDPRFARTSSEEGAARVSMLDQQESAVPRLGEGHQRWRRMLTKWFTAKRMAVLRPRIEAMAEQLVDEMVAQGQPADLRASFGYPLPVWVICDLLGVPNEDRDRFSHWSDTFLSVSRYTQEEVDAAQTEFTEYMAGHVDVKRGAPGDDLLSDLITRADAAGEYLPNDALVATGKGLLIAGHETTTNMIGKMMAMLLADRSHWEQLLADPELVRTAVEETLRYDANAGFGLTRYLDEDVELPGGTLTAGTTAILSLGSANRDESVFPDAAELDLSRSPNLHISFGVGPHSCVGQSLARTELQVVLEVLLRRLPTLELAVPVAELPPVEGLLVGGLQKVPVRW